MFMYLRRSAASLLTLTLVAACGAPASESDEGSQVVADSATSGSKVVLPSDTVLVRPDSSGPTLGAITAYVWHDKSQFPANEFELPIYQSLERDSDDYWNYLVDELLLSRLDVVMLHGRGCTSTTSGNGGSGDLCPRVLAKFVAAAKRAGAQDVLKVGMWDDTGAYPNNAGVDRLNLSDKANWTYFWDHNIKIWFDTLPKSMWYLMDGKPVIAEWSLGDAFFSNQQGNASALLTWLKSQFKARYGVEPAFILHRTWFENDTTINTNHAVGKEGWFTPKSDDQSSTHTYQSYNGETWGAVAPAFRDANTKAGCGAPCREVTRRNGATLDNALTAGANAKFILLEGWTDMAESAGYYRSNHWRYPNQYINIVRRHADPTPATLRFQAEAADAFLDKTSANLGGQYSDRALDVDRLNDGTGWYVGWTQAGEWLEYKEVELGSGTYRFTVRAATNAPGKSMHLEIDGVPLPSLTLPDTGGFDNYQLAHLGEVNIPAGTHDLKVVFETTAGMNVDWFFLKRK